MPRVNRTQFAVLGMLLTGPRSGYRLKQDFENRISHFWSESLGQIYPALHRLRDEGLVTGRQRGGRGRREQTVYAITTKGRRAFRAWFEQPAAPDTVRNEVLLKIFFGPDMPAELVLRHIEQHEADQLERRTLYRYFETEIERQAPDARRALYWKLALASGRHVNRARLAWCREAKALIKAQMNASASEGKAR